MNGVTKSKAALYLAAVFAAGLVAGAAAGYAYGKRTVFRPPPPRQEMAARMIGYLTTELRLTEEQVSQVKPLVAEASADLQAIQQATVDRVAEVIQRRNQRLAALLDVDQCARLREMEKRHEKYMLGPHRHKKPPETAGGTTE
ncbi:MAG: hypothetical protein FJ387_10405 [Verrucomicrobia bacterium]|nr:hypothetical protein [Verrucomicrobiota bacterium]